MTEPIDVGLLPPDVVTKPTLPSETEMEDVFGEVGVPDDGPSIEILSDRLSIVIEACDGRLIPSIKCTVGRRVTAG